jgi:hypothetical protein
MVTMTRVCMGFDIGTTNLGFASALVDEGGRAVVIEAELVNISASSTDASILKLWARLDAAVAESDATVAESDAAAVAESDAAAVADVKGRPAIHVYIEQQPSKARSVMRSVELGVRHYFLMLSRSGRRVVVKSVSSRTKLRDAVVYAPGMTPSQKYRARKKASVDEITRMLCDTAPTALARITCKKADDVCDALLYIVRHGPVDSFSDRDRPCRAATESDT